MFLTLAKQADATDPKALAAQLSMLYDGAVITARMDRSPTAAKTAKTMAATLIEAAIPA